MRSIYVFLDDLDRPLYAGRTVHFRRRLAEHRKQSTWFDRATSVAWARVPDKESDHRAERYTLATLHPAENGPGACTATVETLNGWPKFVQRKIAPWCESIKAGTPLVESGLYGHVVIREPEPDVIPVRQWLKDCGTLLTAAMYGCPPGGWSDPDRKEAFVAEVADIERRMQEAARD